MATPRTLIAARVAADHPGYDVRAYPYTPAEVRRPLVVLYRESLVRGAAGLTHTLTGQLYIPRTVGERAEADLDTALDNVMLSLQRLDTVTVTRAERKIFDDVFQGWELTIEWVSADYYQSTVNAER